MYFLLLLPIFALAGVGVVVRRRVELWGNVLVGMACLGLVGLIVWQARHAVFSNQPDLPPQDTLAMNAMLTGLVQQDVRGKSGVVLLVFPDEKVLKQDAMENKRNSFRGILLRGHPELKVETARLKTAKGAAASGADFKAAISQVTNVIAVVSYAGVPADIEQAFGAADARRPLLYAYDASRGTHWVAAVKQRILRCVIVPRPGISPEKQAELGGMPMENFDKLYLVATAGNVDQVAATLGGK